MDRLAHRVVAAEGEGDVGDAPGDQSVGQVLLDPAGGLDEVHRVVVVLGDAGGHGEDVGVEDDVFGGEAFLLGEDAVGALADFDLALVGVGLAFFVEGHDDHRRAVAAAEPRLLAELGLPLLEGDGVDDGLALHALQARLDDLPLGGVDHEGHLGDLRLGSAEVEKAGHGRLAVQHRLVHVDVHHLGAVLHLGAAHLQRFFVFFVEDQALEFGRAGDVGPFTHVDEERILGDVERLQSRQTAGRFDLWQGARRLALHRFSDGGDVLGGGAAAAADDVEKARFGPLADLLRHLDCIQIVLAELVGQAGVGVGGDEGLRDPRQLLHVLAQQVRPQSAVEADGERLGVAQAVVEGFGHLARESAPRLVGDGARDHDGQAPAQLGEDILHRKDGRLGVEGVEDGLDEDDVSAALDETAGRLAVVFRQFVEGDGAKAGIVDVRGDGEGLAGGAQHPRHEAWLLGRAELVRRLPRQSRRRHVDLIHQVFHAIVGHGDAGGVEAVGLQDVGARFQVLLMDAADDLGPGEAEQVVGPFEIGGPVGEALAAVVGLGQLMALDHGAHGAVQQQDAPGQQLAQAGFGVGSHGRRNGWNDG